MIVATGLEMAIEQTLELVDHKDLAEQGSCFDGTGSHCKHVEAHEVVAHVAALGIL